MAVVKNMSTEVNREFWSHVEAIAAQVRSNTEGAPCRAASEEHLRTFDHAPSESLNERIAASEERD